MLHKLSVLIFGSITPVNMIKKINSSIYHASYFNVSFMEQDVKVKIENFFGFKGETINYEISYFWSLGIPSISSSRKLK